jgi:hypothetical protein
MILRILEGQRAIQLSELKAGSTSEAFSKYIQKAMVALGV